MTEHNPTPGILTLFNDSKARAKSLEAQAFARGATLASRFPLPRGLESYFVVTGDLTDGLLYSPVTNLPHGRAIVARVDDEQENSVLDTLRNVFPIEPSDHSLPTEQASDHLVSRVCRAVTSQRTSTIIALVVDRSGNVSTTLDFNQDKPSPQIPSGVLESLGSPLRLGTEVNKYINQLRTGLAWKGRAALLFEAGSRHSAELGGQVIDLIRMGLIVFDGEDLIDVAESFRVLADVSEVAALSHLGEKERYLQKALRQAVRGSIIKCGSHDEISEQVEILTSLHDDGKYDVPNVQDKDPHLLEHTASRVDGGVPGTEKRGAWYRMPRFELPSMFDVLTATEGLLPYEVRALTQACMRHLRDTYWGASEGAQRNEVDPQLRLAVLLAVACTQVESTCKEAHGHLENISAGRPTHIGRGVDVLDFDPGALFRYSQIANTMGLQNPSTTTFDITVDWTPGGDKLPCLDAGQKLASLWKALKKRLGTKDSPVITVGANCRIHGDAHFGNFLVDASIPEDAFVVTIDPRKVDYSSAAEDVYKIILQHFSPEKMSMGMVTKELNSLAADPVLDVAKIMLSTSCAYGIIYRNAFESVTVDSHNPRKRVNFVLKHASSRVRKLSETGGISGAQIVRVDAPVVTAAWGYHGQAARDALEEFLHWIGPSLSREVPGEVTVALVGVWLLTVRNAFSIAQKLFPREPEKGMGMYLSAMRFLNRGCKEVANAIEKPSSNDSLAELRRVFTL